MYSLKACHICHQVRNSAILLSALEEMNGCMDEWIDRLVQRFLKIYTGSKV